MGAGTLRIAGRAGALCPVCRSIASIESDVCGLVLGPAKRFQGLAKGGWSRTPFLAGWIWHQAWLVWKGDDVLESFLLIKGWCGIGLKVVSRGSNKPGNQQLHLRWRTFLFERRDNPNQSLLAFYMSMKTPSEPANNDPSNNNENNAPSDNPAEIKNNHALCGRLTATNRRCTSTMSGLKQKRAEKQSLWLLEKDYA